MTDLTISYREAGRNLAWCALFTFAVEANPLGTYRQRRSELLVAAMVPDTSLLNSRNLADIFLPDRRNVQIVDAFGPVADREAADAGGRAGEVSGRTGKWFRASQKKFSPFR